MRPRPEGRGELEDSLTITWGSTGFNAATTRRPWRTRSPGASPTRTARFNAATTRRPWRTAARDPKTFAAEYASMRPRPEGRGERHCGRAQTLTRRDASMRPRPEGRGERRRLARACETPPAASMRPRPEGRGEQRPAPAVPERSDQASMRPRPEGRGERKRRAWRKAASAGGFNAATTRRPWRTVLQRLLAPHVGVASMRPRPEGRGEQLQAEAK